MAGASAMAFEKKWIPCPVAALKRADTTHFARQDNRAAASSVIRKQEHLKLTAHDSLRVRELLENPPAPNAKLRATAKALPGRK